MAASPSRTVGHRLVEAWRAYWNPPLATRDPALAAYFGAGPTASGETVTEATALTFSAVWAAVQVIAGDVASLPLIHYKHLPEGGKARMPQSPLYRVLHDVFNPEMSAFTGRETMQAHVLIWGNAYAEIQRNEANQVVALWPIEPHRVVPYRETPTSPIRYRVTNPSGRQTTLADDEVFHVRGLSYDGLQGYSVIQKARESIGAGLAAERFTNTFYANGVVFSGTFEHPKALGDTAYQRLTESIAAAHQGSAKAGGFRILEEGMTFKPGGMPLKDAEYLTTRKFQVTEIARWFGVPPHKLGDLERATFSNIEHESINYVIGTLRGRWLVRWEKEIQRKLIPALEQRQQFAEHLIDGLLRGDIQSRYAAYAVGRQWGWLSADDVREYENQNPLPDGQGQVYLVPSNMAPADRVNDIIDAQVRPDPAPAPATSMPASPESEPEPERTEAVQALVADLKAEIVQRLSVQELLTEVRATIAAAQVETVAAITARLATDEALRGWQEATIMLLAGKLVRRELAHAKKRAGDPERHQEKVAAFYGRFVEDAVADLRPWLARLNRREDESRVRGVLQGWAVEGERMLVGTPSVVDLVRAWEVDREALLTRALMEVLA